MPIHTYPLCCCELLQDAFLTHSCHSKTLGQFVLPHPGQGHTALHLLRLEVISQKDDPTACIWLTWVPPLLGEHAKTLGVLQVRKGLSKSGEKQRNPGENF